MTQATHTKHSLSKETLHADEILHLVASDIDTSLINPINAESVRKTFTKESCEPDFLYTQLPSFLGVDEQLRALDFEQTPEGVLLQKKRDFLLTKTALIRSIGTKKFTTYSKRIYPLPNAKLLLQAKEILAQKNAPRPPTMGVANAHKELQQCVEKLGIPWTVKKANMIASACVIPSKRIVYLKEKKRFGTRFIERLKIHEIGTHAIRAENGRLQPLKLFLHGLAGYLPTEEGLAAYNEEQFNLLDQTVLKTYAGRVLAIHLAQKYGFCDLVQQLQEYVSEKKALTLALRAKRGILEGTQKGGYTKDSVYLKGYLSLKEYEKKGGDFLPLYYGKVGLSDLKILEKMDLVAPKYLPHMIEQKNTQRT